MAAALLAATLGAHASGAAPAPPSREANRHRATPPAAVAAAFRGADPDRLTLLHPDLERQIDQWLRRSRYSWRQLLEGEIAVDGHSVTLDELQVFLIDEDPAIWAECYLLERTGPRAGLPWELWPYQRASMRYRGNTVHECGAEVGKTREIIALHLWQLLTQRGDWLIGAAQDGHLDSIWDELMWQVDATPALAGAIDRDKTRVKPYKKLGARNGNLGHLRPAGHDGEAFRGIHVGGRISLDEAAKIKARRVFDELYRAAMPGCEIRIYSTPDGDRTSRFFELCQASSLAPPELVPVPASTMAAASLDDQAAPTATTPQHQPQHPQHPPQHQHPHHPASSVAATEPAPTSAPASALTKPPAAPQAQQSHADALPSAAPSEVAQRVESPRSTSPGSTVAGAPQVRRFLRFRWPKTLMPAPFWSPTRRAEYLEQYGGIDSPGYQQNVLGNWGDASGAIFPWEQFAPRCVYVREYVRAAILWDASSGRYLVTADRLNPAYEPGARLGDDLDPEAATRPQPLLALCDEEIPAREADILPLLGRLFAHTLADLGGAAGVHLVGGIDVGSTDDPTEILFEQAVGERRRIVARLTLKRHDLPRQRDAILALDHLFRPSLGWGIDSGGIGSGLEHALCEGNIVAGEWRSLADRITGVVFNARRADVDESTGDALLDPSTGRERTVGYKELGTRLLESAIQRARVDYPRDPDILRQYPNQVARRVSANGERQIPRQEDHVVDADRVARIRLYELDHGPGREAPISYAVPGGARRTFGTAFDDMSPETQRRTQTPREAFWPAEPPGLAPPSVRQRASLPQAVGPRATHELGTGGMGDEANRARRARIVPPLLVST